MLYRIGIGWYSSLQYCDGIASENSWIAMPLMRISSFALDEGQRYWELSLILLPLKNSSDVRTLTLCPKNVESKEQKNMSFNIWRDIPLRPVNADRPFSALCFHLVRDVFFLSRCRSNLTFGTELDFFNYFFFSPGVVHQCDQGWRKTPKAMKVSLSFNHCLCHVPSLWKKKKEEEKKQADVRALYR